MEYIIDGMGQRDWPQVAEIYRYGIATKIATYETEPPSWEVWDAGHIESCRLVARVGDKVLGWTALSRYSERYCYRGVAEVSIYIAPEVLGKGIGSALLQQTIREAEKNGFWSLEARIIRENKASLALHRKCGFTDVGIRRRLGQMDNGKWHDVWILEYRSETVGMD